MTHRDHVDPACYALLCICGLHADYGKSDPRLDVVLSITQDCIGRSRK